MIIILLIGLVMIGGMVAFLVYVGKRGGFSTKMRSQITMRAGEVSLLATEIVWFAKKFYWNKYKIPHGYWILQTSGLFIREPVEIGLSLRWRRPKSKEW